MPVLSRSNSYRFICVFLKQKAVISFCSFVKIPQIDILLVCFPDFIDWLKNVITEEMEENEKERAIPYDKDTDSEYIIIPNEL